MPKLAQPALKLRLAAWGHTARAEAVLASIRTSVASAFALVAILVGSPAIAQRAAQAPDANLGAIRVLLQMPDADIDLAKAKLTIDRMIDPTIDSGATLAQLDVMANGI